MTKKQKKKDEINVIARHDKGEEMKKEDKLENK